MTQDDSKTPTLKEALQQPCKFRDMTLAMEPMPNYSRTRMALMGSRSPCFSMIVKKSTVSRWPKGTLTWMSGVPGGCNRRFRSCACFIRRVICPNASGLLNTNVTRAVLM